MSPATWFRTAELCALFVVAAVFVPGWSDEPKPRRYALLVGVRNYEHSKLSDLKYTENDAEEAAKLLVAAKYDEVVVLTTTRGAKDSKLKPTKANVERELARLLKKVKKHDVVLIGLSGHGVQYEVKKDNKKRDESFFCPADAKIINSDDFDKLSETLISFRKLFDQLDDSGAGSRLLLVDACRNDPGSSRNADTNAMPNPTKGTAALFSCKGGERAFETAKLGKGHGVFFFHVIEALKGNVAKDKKGNVTWDGLTKYVRAEVRDTVEEKIGGGARQTPHLMANVEGDPVLIPLAKEEIKKDKSFDLVVTCKGHKEGVYGVAFSPDGKSLLTASGEPSVKVFQIATGKQVKTFGGLNGHKQMILAIAMNPDGTQFTTAGADNSAKVWDFPTSKRDGPTRNLPHPQSVNCLAYNKDGSLLATGCADGKVRIWDVAKGTVKRDVASHTTMNYTAIYCVAFSPDEKTVISGSIDQTLKLWNVADGKIVREFKAYDKKEFPKGHKEAVLSVAFSPDGKQIASGSMDMTIKIWDVADGSVVKELTNPAFKPEVKEAVWPAHPGWVYGLRWSTGSKKLISAGAAPRLKGYLATWDPATGKLLSGKELSYGNVFALALSADEKQIALGTGGSVRSGEEFNLGVVLKTPE